MRYNDFLLVYNAGPEATYKLLLSIMENSLKQSAQLSHLEDRIEDIEERANRNSQKSNKPSAADLFVKPQNRRKMSDKAPGGQKGHAGKTLEMSLNPHNIEKHRVKTCSCCGEALENEPVSSVDKRQVFDIPPQKIIVTEHQSEKKTYPSCGVENRAPFPAGVEKPVQYGTFIKSALVYLNQYQMIPYKRTLELISDFYNHQISEGTLFNSISSAYDALEPVERKNIELLLQSPVNYADETGLRIGGNLQRMHLICNENLTHYAPHAKRGMEAFTDIGILTRYRGSLVHDFWKPYFKLVCEHGLRNAHHIRELTGIEEFTAQSWPQELSEFLLKIKDFVENSKAALTDSQIDSYSNRYDLLIEKGYLENHLHLRLRLRKGDVKNRAKLATCLIA